MVVGGGLQNLSNNLSVNGTSAFSGDALFNGKVFITNEGYLRSVGIAGGGRTIDLVSYDVGDSHRFLIGGEVDANRKFVIENGRVASLPNLECYAIMKSNTYDTVTNADCSFRRNNVKYMKFEGSLSSVEMPLGLKSNIFNGIGNTDVSFRRNSIDFFYLRNNAIETNTGIAIQSSDVRVNNINTIGDVDMVFSRNGVEYFKLDDASGIIDVEVTKALSTNYLYFNFFRARTLTYDSVFEGANTAGSSYTEYARYRRTNEDFNFSEDVYINQDKKLYLHRGTSQDLYLYSRNVASVNHLEMFNEDVNGEIRLATNGSYKIFIRPNDITLGAGVVFSGDFNDVSTELLKYDIKEANFDFTSILKSIEPKTFRLKKEKEIGMNKNHIGFVAENVEEHMPEELENIVNVNQDGIKTLNYIKLNAFLWGAVREQQDKIEHLESRMFEMMEEIKELKGKPKSKAKAKAKN